MFVLYFLTLALFVFFAATAASSPDAPSPRVAYGAYASVIFLFGGFFVLATMAMVSTAAALPSFLWYALLLAAAIFSLWRARLLLRQKRRARRGLEQLALIALAFAAFTAVLITIGIVASVVFESVRFFQIVPLSDFLFGLHWSPQIAIRADQAGASGSFGFLPLFVGTLLISAIAMVVAAPLGFLAAVYLSEFASRSLRNRIKPMLEILAGVPTIVYGFFAVTILSPLLVDLGQSLGLGIVGENALAAGFVMGVMLIPFIASLSEDAFQAVPGALRQGALGLGSTRFEAIRYILVPAAMPGIVAGLLLAFSRAVGETMIVVMAAGISANLSINPLQAVTTVTVQIVTLLTGDQEFDDPKTLAAFALGLILLCVTLCFNLVALRIVRKYQERYE